MENFMAMIITGMFNNFMLIGCIIMVIGIFSTDTKSNDFGYLSGWLGFYIYTLIFLFVFNGFTPFSYFLIYTVVGILVSGLQIFVFDMKVINRKITDMINSNTGCFYHRWAFVNESGKVQINTSELAGYMLYYVITAPFIVLNWITSDLFKIIAERIEGIIVRRISNMLSQAKSEHRPVGNRN